MTDHNVQVLFDVLLRSYVMSSLPDIQPIVAGSHGWVASRSGAAV